MNPLAEKNLNLLVEHLRKVDELTLVILKGHLVIEEQLERIITTFVFHPSYIEESNLRFAQKVAIARSMSLDEPANPLWELIVAINALRNELAHVLTDEKRKQKLARVKNLYFEANAAMAEEDRKCADHEVASFAVAFCLGFLTKFQEEVARFREHVDSLDRVANPHRHEEKGSK
jgi:tRNA(Phe) wybutosine-synthesizing methylase Tyw3